MTISITNVSLGNLALASIRKEFAPASGTPVSLLAFKRGGIYVPASQGDAGYGVISNVNPVNMGPFRNQSAQFVFNDVVSVNLNQYNLHNRAISAGWNGVVPLIATITINAGVYVYSNSVGTPAFVEGSLTSGSTVALTNNGTIVGAGGAGGTGGNVSGASFSPGGTGGTGGDALAITYNILIVNNGTIAGGGGGGGGGAAARNTLDKKNYYGASGGGGGGGQAFGTGASPGTSSGNATNGVASAGSAGTASAPGAGGASYVIGSTINSGVGGAGGFPGQYGASGGIPDQGYVNGGQGSAGSGGGPGNAITGGSLISWNAHGLILGHVDSFGIWTNAGADNTSQMGSRFTNAKGTGLNGAWTSALGSFWYWNVPRAGVVNQPAGTITFSRFIDNTTGSSQTVHLYGAVDNALTSTFLNGSNIGITMSDPAYTTPHTSANFILPQGANVITVTLNNSAVSAAGFNLRVRRTSDSFVFGGPDGWFF